MPKQQSLRTPAVTSSEALFPSWSSEVFTGPAPFGRPGSPARVCTSGLRSGFARQTGPVKARSSQEGGAERPRLEVPGCPRSAWTVTRPSSASRPAPGARAGRAQEAGRAFQSPGPGHKAAQGEPTSPAALGAAGLPEPSDPAPARASQPRPPCAARRRRRRRHFLPLAVASFPLSGYSIHLGPEPPAPHRAAPRPLPPAPAETAQRPARPQPALGPRRRRTAAWRIPPASRHLSAPRRLLAPRPHESRPVIGRSAEVKG
ncbi:hypothetical protein ACRRTK_017720 [Alexandromys fortis]